MKKSIIISIAIILILVILFTGIYLSVNNSVKRSYTNSYNQCLQVQDIYNLSEESLNDSYIQECLNNGGCFNPCGSMCSPTKPSITFFKMFNYIGTKACPEVCVRTCAYPLEKFNAKS